MKTISSSLFENFIENNIEGIWIIDSNDKTTFVNPVISAFLGYPQDFFIGKEIGTFLEDGEVVNMKEKLANRKIGIAEHHELKFLTADGNPIWVNAACSPLFNENKEYVGAVGVLTDITQKKKNETILEAQKNVFEALIKDRKLEASLIHLLRPIEKLVKGVYPSILLLDETGEYLLTGASIHLPDEYNQAIHGVPIGPHTGSCGTSAFTKKLVVTSDITTDPNWANYKDIAEKFKLAACWSSPIISFEGKVLGTFAMYFGTKRAPSQFELELVNDVSVAATLCIEHIRLLKQEKKYTQMTEVIAEARYLLSGTIEYEDVVKKLPDLFVRRGLADWSFIVLENEEGFFRPNSIAAIPELLNAAQPLKSIEMDLNKNFGLCRAIKNNTSFIEVLTENQLLQFLTEEGLHSPGPYLTNLLMNLKIRSYIAAPLTIRNRVVGGLIVARTDPNQSYGNIDLELIREIARSCALAIDNALLYREAKKSIEAREDFIAVASHELRTPITSLKMRVDLLAMMLQRNKFPQEVKDVLAPIISELQPDVKNFTKLIEALLDISKIGDRNISLSKGLCDISAIAKDEAQKLKSIFEENQTDLLTEINEGFKGYCDQTRIRQIITSLLSNALKFGNKKPVTLIVKSDGLTLCIWVKDNGIGISKEDTTRIFKPFERAVSDKYFGGLGLGLYITERIVKSHDGNIKVESKPGHGTTFKVEIPLLWKY